MNFLTSETLAAKSRLDSKQRHEAFWQGRKKKFFLAIGVLGFLLQILFLGNMAYLYGSIWKSTSRTNNFRVLMVDYDQGVIGQALSLAYKELQGPSFPSLIQRPRELYPTMQNVMDAVKSTEYWAAFVTAPNASDTLSTALQGGSAAQAYQPSNALKYVWNEVRYPPFSDEVFEASFQVLTLGTAMAFAKLNGSGALDSLNRDDPAALQVLLHPIDSQAFNLMKTVQQTKLFFNTVSMVMPILQQFFFLLVLNGISTQLELYSKLPLKITGLVRAGLGVSFGFVASLCMTGYIWAFRESWEVNADQFVLSWMVLWLLMHIHFMVIDTVTALLPLPALPFFLLTWIIVNITSSISPFEANPGFYRWGYALPTNAAYTTLTDIWSFGAVPQLHRALPVLFSWWIAGCAASFFAHLYRCHKAWMADETEKMAERH